MLNLVISKYRRATCDEATLRDEQTGKVVLIKSKTNLKTGAVYETIIKDTFFFIPIKFWCIIFFVLGILVFF